MFKTKKGSLLNILEYRVVRGTSLVNHKNPSAVARELEQVKAHQVIIEKSLI